MSNSVPVPSTNPLDEAYGKVAAVRPGDRSIAETLELDPKFAVAHMIKGLSYLGMLKVNPVFDPLRSDPLFERLVKRVGLP